MENKFVDRKDIQKKFLDDIKLSTDINKVVILTAGQGVGKSELTRVVSKKLNSHLVFRVKTSFFSGKGVSAGAYYKSFVNSAISLREKGDLPSFVDFLREKPKETVSRVLAGIIKAASNFDPVTSKIINFSHNIAKITDNDLGNLISSRNVEVQLSFSSYILSSIKDKPVLLIVENAQCLDEEFIEFIGIILKNSNNIYCILEYTSDVISNLEKQELLEIFSERSGSCQVFDLERLPSNYALQIVSSNDDNSLKVIKEYYEKSDGNLKPLQQMSEYRGVALSSALNLMPISTHGIEVVTVNAFESLKSDEKYILAIINIVDGFININELKKIFDSDGVARNNYSLRSYLENLKESEFIEIISDHVLLKDDVSFRKIGGDSYLGRYEQVALIALKKHYNSKDYTFESSTPEDILLKKLRISINLHDNSEISRLADEAIEYASLSNSPWLYIKPIADWIIKETYSKSWYKLTNKLIVASVNFSEYQVACNLLEVVKKTEWYSKEDNLIYALVLLKLNKPVECLSEIDKIMESIEEIDQSLEVRTEVVRFTAYYYLSEFKKAKSIYTELVRHTCYKRNVDRGFILSCSTMVNTYSESVLDLTEAVEIFEENFMPISSSRAKNKLAIDLARMGELDKANDLIRESYDVLYAKKIDRSILINNIESVKIQKGEIDDELLENLNDLLIIVRGVYEKVIINNNLMIAHSLMGEFELAVEHAYRIIKIIESDLYIDDGIRWTLKNNFIFLESKFLVLGSTISSKVKDFELSSIPKHKLCKKIDSGHIFFKNAGERYYAEMSYRSMYLSHWAIEF